MPEKRYYWLKLQEDFFSSVRIKRLRKIAGGDTYTIIYLKMQLMAIRNGGVLRYCGWEKSFAEELALDMDEDAENVAVTLQYLLSCGLIETSDNIEFLLPFAVMNTGSEGSGAQRVRDYRERKKALQRNANVTQTKQICNGEKEIEKEIEIERDTPPYPPKGGDAKSKHGDERFDKFWSAYPKKVGKIAAKKAFERVSVPLESLLSAIERQKCGSQWSRDNGRYIPNPATWLNQGRWDDDVQSGGAGTGANALTSQAGHYGGRDFFDE